jgi:predicted peptidase
MPNIIPKLTLFLLIGFIISSCQKDVKPDPRKVANNSRVETMPPSIRPVYQSANPSSAGFYVGLPYLYDSTTKSYPLIISIHGAGQQGNGSSNLPSILYDGIPHVYSIGNFPPNFEVNGQNYSFIMLAPQFKTIPNNYEIEATINYAKKNFRVDAKRIYLTGLSMGGAVSWDAGAQLNGTIAAIVPISGVPKDDGNLKAKTIAEKGLPAWAFHNENDNVTNSVFAKNYVATINSFSPKVPPKLTIFKAEGHDAWAQATNPQYKEGNMNIYEWMLQYSK